MKNLCDHFSNMNICFLPTKCRHFIFTWWKQTAVVCLLTTKPCFDLTVMVISCLLPTLFLWGWARPMLKAALCALNFHNRLYLPVILHRKLISNIAHNVRPWWTSFHEQEEAGLAYSLPSFCSHMVGKRISVCVALFLPSLVAIEMKSILLLLTPEWAWHCVQTCAIFDINLQSSDAYILWNKQVNKALYVNWTIGFVHEPTCTQNLPEYWYFSCTFLFPGQAFCYQACQSRCGDSTSLFLFIFVVSRAGKGYVTVLSPRTAVTGKRNSVSFFVASVQSPIWQQWEVLTWRRM